MNLAFKTYPGSFRDPVRQQSRRSAVLILTLAILTIITLMLIAFVAIMSRDRGATQNYAQSLHAEQIGLGGLDQIVAQLQAEITDSSLSTLSTSSVTGATTNYIPIANTNAVPQRMSGLSASLPTLVKISTNEPFFISSAPSPANTGVASPSLSTQVSLNGRSVSIARWNKPQLLLSTNNFPVPNWVIVTRNGPQASTTASLSQLANAALANTSYAIGRYAYVVYDTSGLIDVNVAGNPINTSGTYTTNTGVLAYADLTQLANTITVSDVTNLIQWRNAGSYTNYSAYTNYVANWATNGFMQVASGDTAFLSRQELIKYAQNQNPDLTSALPYLTTFSREFNGPTYLPTTNIAYNSGTGMSGTNNYNYLTLAKNDTGSGSVTNAFFMTARVQHTFTRNNGTTAVVGEPLVKYRFPLDKLALLASFDGPNGYTYADWTANTSNIKTNIQKYFGLDLAADSNSTYHHWTYPTTTYSHTAGTILSLNQVAALGTSATAREPDFFELIQAGILNGSVGYYTSERSDGAEFKSTYPDPDLPAAYQIIRIGANIIDQWKSDNYPTTITYNSKDFYGIEDLPYINQVFLKTYDEGSYTTKAAKGSDNPGPWDYVLYYELWNPHQPSTSSSSPTVFQVAPNYTNNIVANAKSPITVKGDAIGVQIIDLSNDRAVNNGVTVPKLGAGHWYWTATTTNSGSWNNTTFSYTPITTTNTFPAASTDYREPSLITNSSAVPTPTATYGGWTAPYAFSGQLVAQTTQIPSSLISLPPTNSETGTYWTNELSYSTNFPTNNSPNPYFEQWELSSENRVGLLLQYSESSSPPNTPNPGGSWHTYATFEGFTDGTGGYYQSASLPNTNNVAATTNTPLSAFAFVKVDPRTGRWGPGSVFNQLGTYNNAGAFNQTTTSQVQDKYRDSGSTLPFIGSSGSPHVYNPYRIDMWAVNQTNYNRIQGDNLGLDPSYADSDGVTRGGDATYGYYPNGYTPLLPSIGGVMNPARPIILHRPFQSVGELGYVYRDQPWRTLDLFTTNSADAGLLDLFTLTDTPVMAGRVNPNTPYDKVIAALLSGAPTTNAASTGISASAALSFGTAMTNITVTAPIMNRAGLVTSILLNSAAASAVTSAVPTQIKTQSESVIRALAESANTRTWNFMIDIIAQSGNYPPSQATPSLDNFVVTGERRYWLHIAIDRYTGQIVDKQLEVVNE